MVFHDEDLSRMADVEGPLRAKTAAELSALKLKGTSEPIPTLKQVLDLVASRALILVEIKSRPGEEGPLDEQVSDVIAGYGGPLAIIGFNPYSHAWWAAHRPEVLRGLDSYGYDDGAARLLPEVERLSFRSLKHVQIARPHFLALDLDMLPNRDADRLRTDGYPIVAWTVRSSAQQDAVGAFCDNMIFEGFTP